MITYLRGDATNPIYPTRIIIHVCNDQGGWGAGFSGALSRKWPEAKEIYKFTKSLTLGTIQLVSTADNGIYICNLIAQHGYQSSQNPKPCDLVALEDCLKKVVDHVELLRRVGLPDPSFHMPRIGCGLGGRTWDEIEPIIQRTIGSIGCWVYVYDI